MDPYLETPRLWQDFHTNLASEIQAQMNRALVPRYRARLTASVTYDVIEVSEARAMAPDVSLWQTRPLQEASPAATATVAPAPVANRVPLELPLRLHRVEIRATETGQLVTVIEVLSPVNKRPSHPAFATYGRKRKALLHSAVHLLEIDLLRRGVRPPLEEPNPYAPYYVMLSRTEHRPEVQVWPIQLADPLPALPVPLLEPDPDACLDLGAAVSAVYDRCAYVVDIDYRKPPPRPPLSPEEADWVDTLLREKGLRTEGPARSDGSAGR
jgi:hypothetical protein